MTAERERKERGREERGKKKRKRLLCAGPVPVFEELSSPGVVVTSQTQNSLYLAVSASLDISSLKNNNNKKQPYFCVTHAVTQLFFSFRLRFVLLPVMLGFLQLPSSLSVLNSVFSIGNFPELSAIFGCLFICKRKTVKSPAFVEYTPSGFYPHHYVKTMTSMPPIPMAHSQPSYFI